MPKALARRSLGGFPKGTDARRASGAGARVFHLPKLVLRGVTVAPTLLPRCNICNIWAFAILLLA